MEWEGLISLTQPTRIFSSTIGRRVDQERASHYGASFLFLTYFLDRFGIDITKAVVGDPANGLNAIDDVLRQFKVTDPQTGKPITADDVFADWVLASYLRDGNVADGRYTYHNYPDAPQPVVTDKVRTCPTENNTRDVSQYGVDYIRIILPRRLYAPFRGLPASPDCAGWPPFRPVFFLVQPGRRIGYDIDAHLRL